MSGRGETRRTLSAELEQEIKEEVEYPADATRGQKDLLDAMLEVTEKTRAEISEAVSKEVARKRA